MRGAMVALLGWLAAGACWAGAAAAGSNAVSSRSAPGDGAAVDFVVFGDCRNNLDVAARVMQAVAEEGPAFVLATGDYVNDGANLEEWRAFRAVARPLLQAAPLYTTIGNHDRQGRGRRIDHYRDTFELPSGPERERYYSVDHGTIRIIALDSNAYANAAQTTWLTNTLREGQSLRRKMFVVMHHPVYSIALHGGHEKIRETWAPLFEHYGVQAVFSGHDHVYARAEAGGVRYFTTGGAGAPLYGKSKDPNPLDVAAVKYHARVYHYLRVHVVQDLVEVTAVKLDGTIIERVAWRNGGALGDVASSYTAATSPWPLWPGRVAPSQVKAQASSDPALWPWRQRGAANDPRTPRPSPLWLVVGLGAVLAAAFWLAAR